jgi:hypothetical protein
MNFQGALMNCTTVQTRTTLTLCETTEPFLCRVVPLAFSDTCAHALSNTLLDGPCTPATQLQTPRNPLHPYRTFRYSLSHSLEALQTQLMDFGVGDRRSKTAA